MIKSAAINVRLHAIGAYAMALAKGWKIGADTGGTLTTIETPKGVLSVDEERNITLNGDVIIRRFAAAPEQVPGALSVDEARKQLADLLREE